jgi:hypothetical protein
MAREEVIRHWIAIRRRKRYEASIGKMGSQLDYRTRESVYLGGHSYSWYLYMQFADVCFSGGGETAAMEEWRQRIETLLVCQICPLPITRCLFFSFSLLNIRGPMKASRLPSRG